MLAAVQHVVEQVAAALEQTVGRRQGIAERSLEGA